jgi:hypothetical protein
MTSRIRRLAIVIIICVGTHVGATSASAQVAVIDPINIARAIITASELAAVYEQQQRLYAIWDEYRQALAPGAKRKYLSVDVPWRTHLPVEDPFDVYRPLMDAIDLGDPRGAAYERVVGHVPPYPTEVIASLEPATRQRVAASVGAVMATDGWARLAIHTLGQGREGGLASTRALDTLQRDFTSDERADNGSIAVLQEIAGADLLTSRDNQIGNQMLSSLLEAAVVRHLRLRDALASALHVDIERRHNYLTVAKQANQDTSQLIQGWRLP